MSVQDMVADVSECTADRNSSRHRLIVSLLVGEQSGVDETILTSTSAHARLTAADCSRSINCRTTRARLAHRAVAPSVSPPELSCSTSCKNVPAIAGVALMGAAEMYPSGVSNL